MFFWSQDKEIQNIEISNTFEFSDKTVNLSSLMAFKYKNNLQNADSNYFSKSLYLLEDSVIGNNKTYFNISGNMDIQTLIIVV